MYYQSSTTATRNKFHTTALPKLSFATTGYKYAFEAATIGTALGPGELLKMRGPAIFLERISANRRRYIPESVHAQVRLLQPRVEQKALFGELDHPPTQDLNRLAYVDMHNMSHRIDAIWYDEKTKAYWIDVTVFDTPSGRILKAIHDAGSPLYVSLRSILDPAKNIQQNGFVDAWMMALITIDFVSQPGFSDAVMQTVEASTESNITFMRGVCEAYSIADTLAQLNTIANNSRNHNLNQTYMKRRRNGTAANESIVGNAIQPSGAMQKLTDEFVADLKAKFPKNITASTFLAEYNGAYNGSQVGLYEDAAKIALTNPTDKTTAVISLDVVSDGEFAMPKDAEISFIEAGTSNITTGDKRTDEMNNAATAANEQYELVDENDDLADGMYKILEDGLDQKGNDTEPEEEETEEDKKPETATEAKMYNLMSSDGKPCYLTFENGMYWYLNYKGGNSDLVGHANDSREDVIKKHKLSKLPKDKQIPVEATECDSPEKIAEEAARIFQMPNSKYANNYAIEHCPLAYKAMWNGLTENAKAVIAKRAMDEQIGTEAANLKFWSKLDVVALERSLLNVEKAEAGLECFKPIDARANFLHNFTSIK